MKRNRSKRDPVVGLYHGSGESIAPGERLRPKHDRYNYLAATESWADAFAFRDAASRAVHAAVQQVIDTPSGPDLSLLHSAVSDVTGFIHDVEVAGRIQRDPDFLDNDESLRTADPVTVAAPGRPGTVRSWREFISVVGPYQKWVEGLPAFDNDGYLQPPPSWESWGYTGRVLQALGQWYPMNGVWENKTKRTLVLVSEFSLPFGKFDASPDRDQLLTKLNARVPFSPEAADRARTTWWQ